MRITRHKIEQAVFNRFGVITELVRGNGYYYFSSAGDDASDDVIYRLPTTSVYTMQLNGGSVTLDWWLGYFEDFLIGGGFIEVEKYQR